MEAMGFKINYSTKPQNFLDWKPGDTLMFKGGADETDEANSHDYRFDHDQLVTLQDIFPVNKEDQGIDKTIFSHYIIVSWEQGDRTRSETFLPQSFVRWASRSTTP